MASPQFTEAIRPLLELIDRGLAHAETRVPERSFLATVQLIREFIPAVKLGDEPETPPPDSVSELLATSWAASVFVEVHNWYRERYGRAADQHSDSLDGFVLLHDTPFELRVPPVESRIDEPGKTCWMSFLSEVREDDDPFCWIISPPDRPGLPENALVEVRGVAGLLRSINVKLLGVPKTDKEAWGLLAGIPVHLRSAADLALRQWRDGSTDRAFWELQMACECAFKTLTQLKTGTFRETHDLFTLYDDVAQLGISLSRDILKELPRWREAKSLHYGQADKFSLRYYYHSYRVTLGILDSVLKPAVENDFSRMSLKLAADPWRRALWDSDDQGRANPRLEQTGA